MRITGIFKIVVACLLAASLEGVTVNPSLCPTNKIAPHKRLASWERGTGRTFGAFYDLLAPGNPQADGPNLNDLQEQPQEDDPTDCGEIEDYDENDLSSTTPQEGNRRKGHRDGRGFFIESLFNSPQYPQRPPSNYPQRPPSNYPQRPPVYPPNYPQRPPNYPQIPPNYPQRPPNFPQRPPNYPRPPSTNPPQEPLYPATRPPYWSGGLFGSNGYRPPLQQNPSDSIKPIHEYSGEAHVPYRPNVVGGPLGHVVGFSPIVPTVQDESTTSRTFYNRLRASTPSTLHPTKRPTSRNINNNSIFGSFVDLLFK